MKKIIISFISFFALYASVMAGGGGSSSMYPSDVLYSEDGAHSGMVTCLSDGCSFFYDGMKKSTYATMDYPVVSGNDFYISASDTAGKRYLLKNGSLLTSGESAYFLYGFYNAVNGSQIVGWYTVSSGKYTLYKKDGTVYLQVDNAGTSSSSYYIAEGVVQTTVYNRNNITSTTYINDKKIATQEGGYVQSYGIYKRNAKTSELLISSWNTDGTMSLSFYDISSGNLRNLPGYDGITQVMPILNKNGTIKEFQYVVNIGDKFAFADTNGNLLTKDYFDSVNNFSAYGNTYLKVFTRREKMYLYFNGATYGPYDYIDTFNPSYGTQYNQILRWSVFVKNDGKNYILVNGKQFYID